MSDEHLDVIAQRGASLLIRVDDDHARILDTRHHRVFPTQRIDAALARGYWTSFRGNSDAVAAELASATVVGGTVSNVSSEQSASGAYA